MAINIDTGTVQVTYTPNRQVNTGLPANGVVTEFNDITPSELIVFPSEVRQMLRVEPGMMVILTAYNLQKDTQVSFRKVLRSNGIPATGDSGCCPTVTMAHSISLHSAEIACWKMSFDCPVFILKTPGNYEIDVLGPSADVVITANTIAMQPVNDFGTEGGK